MTKVISIDKEKGFVVLDGFQEVEYAINWLGCDECLQPINNYGQYPILLKLEQYMVLECLRLKHGDGKQAPCLSK